jgi:hypothetical protein
VRLELAPAGALDARWEAEGSRRLFDQPFADGRSALTLDQHDVLGYRIFAHGYGSYAVAGDGTEICAAPPGELEPWLWQRFVIAQVLPFAALLQGIEVFHASGVVIDGRVVAIAGRSGAGKTSLALNLVLAGARFFTDDVLALARDEGTIACQPGAGATNVRDGELRRRAAQGALGEVVGRSEASDRVLLERDERELPLGGVYFVDRARDATEVRLEAVADPYLLLASTFNFVVRTPARLEAQLDTCALMARSAALFRVSSPLATGAAELAGLIGEHARAGHRRGGSAQ